MIRKKGFTLIELLVVIVIIGILASFIVVSVMSSINDANDAKRKADVSQIVKALMVYGASNSTYPTTSGSTCEIGNDCPGEVSTVLGGNIVRDPSGGYYQYSSDGSTFNISTGLSDSRTYKYDSQASQYLLISPIPNGISCSANSTTSISCSWSSSTGATSYELQRDSATIQNTSAIIHVGSGLTCGTSYSYRVRSCVGTSCSNWSSSVSTSTDACLLGSQTNPGSSCLAIKNSGISSSGVYYINPGGTAFQVYCDMVTDGGGWTILMRSSAPAIWHTNSGTPGTGSWSHNMDSRMPSFSSIMVRKVSDSTYKTMTGISTYDIYSFIGGASGIIWRGDNWNMFGGYHLGLYTDGSGGCSDGHVIVSTCYPSWGFGHRHNYNDTQGYVFGTNNPNGGIGTTVFDIGVK